MSSTIDLLTVGVISTLRAPGVNTVKATMIASGFTQVNIDSTIVVRI